MSLASVLGFLLVFLIGFAARRASLCTVRAVMQWVNEHKASFVIRFFEGSGLDQFAGRHVCTFWLANQRHAANPQCVVAGHPGWLFVWHAVVISASALVSLALTKPKQRVQA